jgi:hypothetical protein
MDDKLLKRRLNKHRPHTPQDALRKCGLTLKFIKEGSYREVFEIVGTQWVIKFPLTVWDTYKFGPEVDWLQRHREHSETEISAYLKNRRRKKLKPFVPDLLWWHPGLGVIVMRKYRPVPSTEEYYNAMVSLTEALERYYDQHHDVHRENCGIDIMGNLKIVDMGLLEGI